MVRATIFAFVFGSFIGAASAAPQRLPVPGGAASVREVTGLPESVPDHMLLVEVARTWYGVRDPLGSPEPPLRTLLEHVRTSQTAPAPGPAMPLSLSAWQRLLGARDQKQLPLLLLMNRSAMLLYHGLMGVDPGTLEWFEEHPRVLADLLEDGASAFASAGPAIRIRDGRVVAPGAGVLDQAWEYVVEARLSQPAEFIPALVRRSRGRLAWLYSVLGALDKDALAFASGPAGEHLPDLARVASRLAPEWIMPDRPFWRPAFDLSLVLAFVRPPVRGSAAFWQQVFRSDDLDEFEVDENDRVPLTAPVLLGLLFEEPYLAHARWNVFVLGQELPEVASDAPVAGLALRGAQRHPALAAMLDRIELGALPLKVSLHRASARVSMNDSDGGRGELAAWQGILAVIERAALTGGLDPSAVERALTELAGLPLKDVRGEITGWLLDRFVPGLAARTLAPDRAEALVLQTMAGALTPAGPRRYAPFVWEELPYALNASHALARRMEDARGAQAGPSLDHARDAWNIASGRGADPLKLAEALRYIETPPGIADAGRRLADAARRGDRAALSRAARRVAESIVIAVLPGLAYVPHLAVTEVPELGADVAFRHLFVGLDDGPRGREGRPWRVASGQARTAAGWRMEGSLLLLDVALSRWYVRRFDELPTAAPAFDELDVAAFGQVAAIARARGTPDLDVPSVVRAISEGRTRAAAAADLAALDDMLERAGIDPWRRASVRLGSTTVQEAASKLYEAERWRVGGAPGRLAAMGPIGGRVRLGEAPRTMTILAGRRSTGLVGTGAVDAQVRTAAFLHASGLPHELFGEVVAGVLGDVLHRTAAVRPDDFAAVGWTVSRIEDSRMEEHVLALVADGTLARPSTR